MSPCVRQKLKRKTKYQYNPSKIRKLPSGLLQMFNYKFKEFNTDQNLRYVLYSNYELGGQHIFTYFVWILAETRN